MLVFQLNGISLKFIDKDPNLWEKDPVFIESRKKVQAFKVVNDLAERCVSLVTTSNPILTEQEEQKQYLLQVVEMHRKQIPQASKSMIIERHR